MASSKAIPIIIGVGDIRNKSLKVEDAYEPASLMMQAFHAALNDSGISGASRDRLLSSVDGLYVVPPWSWPYPDLPGLIAERMGLSIPHRVLGIHGGNQPALLCDQAARAIASGRNKVAIVTGAEALASLAACQKAGKMPPPGWAEPDPSNSIIKPSDATRLKSKAASLHSVGLPIQVYPLYENGRRAQRQQSQEDNTNESATMYAEFDAVAVKNEYAWNYGQTAKSARDIATVSSRNRMIYPLLMNAFNTVNLSATCILTSTDLAEQWGIPREKWIYPLGGAGMSEPSNFWERANFYSSEAISRSLDAALDVSGLTKDDVDLFDFYSCFPIVPKLACDHLGLSSSGSQKPITLLGGLTSFGGAGNNYSMHAITAMARQLRARPHSKGLVLANGGVMSYQHVICLSSEPRTDGKTYPSTNPLPEYTDGLPVPAFDDEVEGAATIETYTVEFGRAGEPKIGYIVGRLESNNHRFIANAIDEATLRELSFPSVEPIGRKGAVKRGDGGRNIFALESGAKL